MKSRGLSAFTLVELLVVVAILALLVAILLPSLSQASRYTRTAICAANLRHIGQAAHARQGELGLEPLAKGWQGMLLPHAGDQGDMFICPEGEPSAYQTDTLMMADRTNGLFTQFVEGPWAMKLSDTQYNAMGLTESKNNIVPPGYKADSNPHIYWICIEDWRSSHSDRDFEDLRVRITEQADGSAELYCKIGGTGHNLELVDEDQELIATKAQMQSGFAIEMGAGLTSYAMNRDAFSMRGPSGQIFVLDFERHLTDGDQVWKYWEDGLPTFARHTGRINVLRIDGEVRLSYPEEIDPALPSNAERHWYGGIRP